MKTFILFFLLLPLSSFANSVYKCEVDGVTTFSQTPCDDKYEKIDVHHTAGKQTNAKDLDNAKQQCLNYHMANFKYPDSVKVEGEKRIWESDNSGARHVLILKVNAKGIDGTYEGAKEYRCYLNHEGSKLSSIQYLVK